MKKIVILAAGVSLAFAVASVQAQDVQTPAPQPAPRDAPAAGAAENVAPAITSVSVVDIEELPEPTRAQVNESVKRAGNDQLERLRASIDGMPQLRSALEAKGATSADVIAASMEEGGRLTLITKKAS